MAETIRLNKYLAHQLGISRREADTYIEQGRIKLNARPAKLGNVLQPGRDSILLDNKPITPDVKAHRYLLINKPIGYVCSRKQQGKNPTIYALLPEKYHRLKVAGRLDKDSCGLVLLTDNGDRIFELTHPKFNKQKIYRVGLDRQLAENDRQKITRGVQLEDGLSTFHVATAAPATNSTAIPFMYTITMSEGRNRQIRRTFKTLGYRVAHLERIQFGPYSLPQLGGQLYLEI